MADTIITPPADTSPATREAFAAVLKAHGHDPDRVAAAMSAQAPKTDTAHAPVDPTAVTQDGIRLAEAKSAADNLRKHWLGDPNELEAKLKELGLGGKPADQPQTDQQKPAADPIAEFDAVPTSPDKYDIHYGAYARNTDEAGLAAVHRSMTGTFAAMQVPGALAQATFDAIMDTEHATASFGEDEAKWLLHARSERVLLDKVTDGKADEYARLARLAIDKLPADVRPSWLPSFMSAKSVIALARIGEAIERRAKR